MDGAFAPAIANRIRAEVDRVASAAAYLPTIAVHTLHGRAVRRAAEIRSDARTRRRRRGRGARRKRYEENEREEEAGEHPKRGRAILVHTTTGRIFRRPRSPRGRGAGSASYFAASGAFAGRDLGFVVREGSAC